MLQTVLRAGVTIMERSYGVGAGGLNEVSIHSDSPAEAFLDILRRSQEPQLRDLITHPIAQELERHSGSSVPLHLAASLLQLASHALVEIVASHPNCAVHSGEEVQYIQRRADDVWTVISKNKQGVLRETQSTSVHIATGAHQPVERLSQDLVAGAPLLPKYSGKLIQSGELFTAAGTSRLLQRLKKIQTPNIVIVGGSTSAGAAAVHLLKQTELEIGAGGITVMHRNPLRLFYLSVEDAHQDGYRDFGQDDVCSITGRVFRLSGFRFEAKQLIRNAMLRSDMADPRLTLFSMAGHHDEARALLEQADVIIAALGYVPRMCDIRDQHGQPIALHTPTREDWAMVDETCSVLTQDGRRIDGVTAMGLAIGPKASPDMGGELNFRGQVNSLWLWQNRLGDRVIERAIKRGTHRIPLLRPAPARLSRHADRLRTIEASNIYSNFGPENTRFERALIEDFFQGDGACVTTCNATLALMLAIKHAVGENPERRRYALMPSFTFAAAAQAALWCGLTPLFCDISPKTWLPCHDSEDALLKLFGDAIAVIVPNATFGNTLDLRRYEALQRKTGIPVVVDAAASLGSLNEDGLHFGAGSNLPIIFSMHATKSFATAEGGVLYSGDHGLIETLRRMSFFGFDGARSVTAPGLNAKLSEVGALSASLQLAEFPQHVKERETIATWYADAIQPRFEKQLPQGRRQLPSFMSVLLPHQAASLRDAIRSALHESGIQTGTYFSPHLAKQSFFQQRCEAPKLPASDDVSSRILSLPLFLGMTQADVRRVADTLAETLDKVCLHTVPAHGDKARASRPMERAS